MKTIKNIPPDFTVTAHSGAMKTKENSIESVVTGAALADIVEVDVCFDAGGTPVLSHDLPPAADSVKLEEVFRVLKERGPLKANLDLKAADDLPEIERLAESFGVLDRVFFTGVTEKMLPDVKGKTAIPYYLNLPVNRLRAKNRKYVLSRVKKVKDSGAAGINFRHRSVTGLLTEVFHENGLLVSVWTVNREKDMKRVLLCGVDNVTTRDPETLRRLAGAVNG